MIYFDHCLGTDLTVHWIRSDIGRPDTYLVQDIYLDAVEQSVPDKGWQGVYPDNYFQDLVHYNCRPGLYPGLDTGGNAGYPDSVACPDIAHCPPD